MCGIAGELSFNGIAGERVMAMLPHLARRGPDQQGFYQEGALAMGHRRLKIIDLSDRAHQPMVDAHLQCSLVFNGTIYNYKALRARLQQQGYHFFSSGDTEVILKAYHCWGERCVEHFEGMFAFAIWDRTKQRLFLCRDRLGIKPLYYSQQSDRFVFASNTMALLAAGGVDTAVDPVALHHQFSLHGVVPAPRTVLRGIRKCPPGHYMTVDIMDGRMETKAYWSLHGIPMDTQRSEQDWLDAVHECLKQAVAKRLDAADVPVGVLLSGGLDSSLLVALLAEQQVSDLNTFSVGFEDQPEEKGSEFEFSDLVVDRYGTRHHKYVIPNREVLQTLPDAIDAMAEPMVAQDAVAFYLLSQRVSESIKVVQSGQGADEVFAGYFWYPQIHDSGDGPGWQHFARHYVDRDHEEYLGMIRPEFRDHRDHTGQWLQQALDASAHGGLLDKVLRLDATTLVVDDPVKRVDNMTMAWGLEARVPFLDHKLVELAAAMPASLKIKEQGKYPLKVIARELLPHEVIDRPKGYFPMPALKYVRGDFYALMHDTLTSRSCLERGIYERGYVERLLREPEQHFTRIQGSKLWHLALLELWLQRHLPGA